MTRERLATLQKAARLIEIDGMEAYRTACSRFGADIADAIVVASMRREAAKGLQAENIYPPPSEIDKLTEKFLQISGILEESREWIPGQVVLFKKLPTNAIFRPAAPNSPFGPNELFRKTVMPSTAVGVVVTDGKYVDRSADLNEFVGQIPVMVIAVP